MTNSPGQPEPEPFTWSEGSALIVSAGSERYLAQRVRDELERRGWSGNELSRRMYAAGHDMSQPVVSRLLSSADKARPKAVTIDQALGLSKVLEIPFGELLLPPDARATATVWRRLAYAARLDTKHEQLGWELLRLIHDLRDDLANYPGLRQQVIDSRDEHQEADRLRVAAINAQSPEDPISELSRSGWLRICDQVLLELDDDEEDETDG